MSTHRSDAVASSPTAELMLDMALANQSSSPIVLNMESIHRFDAFRPSADVNAQACTHTHAHARTHARMHACITRTSMLQLLVIGDIVHGSETGDEAPAVVDVPRTYAPSKHYGSWKNFHIRDLPNSGMLRCDYVHVLWYVIQGQIPVHVTVC